MVMAVPAGRYCSLREAPYPSHSFILIRADLPFLSPSSKGHLQLRQSPKLCPTLPTPVTSFPCWIHGTHLQKGCQYSQAIWVNHCLCKAVILGIVVDHMDLEGKNAILVLEGHHWEMLTPSGLQPADTRAARDMQV